MIIPSIVLFQLPLLTSSNTRNARTYFLRRAAASSFYNTNQNKFANINIQTLNNKMENIAHDEDINKERTALIILNMPIEANLSLSSSSSLFERLWKASAFRVCADGGANRLYDVTFGSTSLSQAYVPDLIRGDLDSIRPHILNYYQQLGCKVERDLNQDCNDLEKSLNAILSLEEKRQWHICVYGAFDGRFDQTMASIQALYKFAHGYKNTTITLYNENTTARLLKGNGILNTIRINNHNKKKISSSSATPTSCTVIEGPACGLLPIGSKCDWVYTTGLVWNLNGESMEFGGLISTSNLIVSSSTTGYTDDDEEEQIVTVKSSHALIWTTELRSHDVNK